MSFFLIWLVEDAFEENIEIKGQGVGEQSGRGAIPADAEVGRAPRATWTG